MAKLTSQESAVLKSMAEGQYAKGMGANTVAWVLGTARKWQSFGSAATKIVLPYLTLEMSVWDTTNTSPVPYEYYVIRAETDAMPDVSTTTVLEKLMQEKRVLARGHACAYGVGIAPRVIKLKFFNVSLEEDEYLVIGILPRKASAAATMYEYFEYEKRELTLD